MATLDEAICLCNGGDADAAPPQPSAPAVPLPIASDGEERWGLGLSSLLRSNGEGDREAVEGLLTPEPIIYQRAAKMRRALTPPEARLWACLKGGKLAGLKFRQQHPVGPYILDFYCPAAKLAIEVDGGTHDAEGQALRDARRTVWLGTQGIEVVRFTALSVKDNLDGILALLAAKATGR